jgi:dephospho-CoA kinase
MGEPIWVAITGGIFTGKTTLAEYLRDEHGFKYVSYTDMLKTFASEALAAVGLEVSVEAMKADKEKYRHFIIALGHLIDFDNGYGLEQLAETIKATCPNENVVVDNMRFEAQMDILERHGFRMLRVVTPIQERKRRARAFGLTAEAFQQRTSDPTETPLAYRPGEIAVMGNGNLHAVYQQIVDAYRSESAA